MSDHTPERSHQFKESLGSWIIVGIAISRLLGRVVLSSYSIELSIPSNKQSKGYFFSSGDVKHVFKYCLLEKL